MKSTIYEYADKLKKLFETIACHGEDSEPANVLREALAIMWHSLTARERRLMQLLGEDYYELFADSELGQVFGSQVPAPIVAEMLNTAEAGAADYGIDDIHEWVQDHRMPSWPLGIYLRGRLWVNHGYAPLAIPFLEIAAQNSEPLRLHCQLAILQALSDSGQWTLALEHAEDVRKSPATWSNAAHAEIVAYRALINGESSSPDAVITIYKNLGRLLLGGASRNAEEVKLLPFSGIGLLAAMTFVFAAQRLGEAHMLRARGVLTRMIAADQKNNKHLVPARAYIYYHSKSAKALRSLNLAAAYFPDLLFVHLYATDLLLTAGRYANAIDRLRIARGQAMPDPLRAIFECMKGLALVGLRETKAAEEAFRRAYALDPRSEYISNANKTASAGTGLRVQGFQYPDISSDVVLSWLATRKSQARLFSASL